MVVDFATEVWEKEPSCVRFTPLAARNAVTYARLIRSLGHSLLGQKLVSNFGRHLALVDQTLRHHTNVNASSTSQCRRSYTRLFQKSSLSEHHNLSDGRYPSETGVHSLLSRSGMLSALGRPNAHVSLLCMLYQLQDGVLRFRVKCRAWVLDGQ